ncbi:hypothetical protein N7532_005912 [Penicillium argentinense]|uniref:GPI inositol-deacylase winged helix domain-containing protein n=1 Tax=Penicillium argentinense TaxID=1131581 RepID=A0A9W9KAV5_9EURO|nr:uncharacterized protein N7532_005912 [Penicillium argentinense]KAJ5098911.1 hypothetical protein N7532_005912 [Penicillium argentinense]
MTLAERKYRFPWVELQLNTFFSPKSKIKRRDRDAFERKLQNLSNEVEIPLLSDVYDDIHEMNIPEPEDEIVSEKLLKWAMSCARPLGIEMLVKAASIDFDVNFDEEDDADYILDICSELIVVDHSQLVQFAHLSVQEYLVNEIKLGYSTVDAHKHSSKFETGDALLIYAALYPPLPCTWARQTKKIEGLQGLWDRLLATRKGLSDMLGDMVQSFVEIGRQRVLHMKEKNAPELESIKVSNLHGMCVEFPGTVQAAISDGLDLNERDDEGDTALAVDCELDNIGTAKLLLEAGANPNAVGRRDGYTSLHHGCNRFDMLKLFIDYGADVTRTIQGPINFGQTVLHRSSFSDHGEKLRYLLEHVSDTNQKGGQRKNDFALYSCSRVYGEHESASHGVDIEIKNNDDETAPQQAAKSGREVRVKIVETLRLKSGFGKLNFTLQSVKGRKNW